MAANGRRPEAVTVNGWRSSPPLLCRFVLARLVLVGGKEGGVAGKLVAESALAAAMLARSIARIKPMAGHIQPLPRCTPSRAQVGAYGCGAGIRGGVVGDRRCVGCRCLAGDRLGRRYLRSAGLAMALIDLEVRSHPVCHAL